MLQIIHNNLVKRLLALGMAYLIAFQPVYLAAQPINPVANSAGRTPGLGSANGVDIINIVKPTNGLSHNVYTDFNVAKSGLIFNNSASQIETQLGGQINGNANITAGQEASTILNEVVGTSDSQLQGMMEVAGPKADVIIANENGITCNGCGFINTGRATLSTGKPNVTYNRHFNSLDVTRGAITIGAQGLNAQGAAQLDLIARTHKVNGKIQAKKLNIIAGKNVFSAGSTDSNARLSIKYKASDPNEAKPEISIDVSAMGGMYGNSINLIATEEGVGVNLGGDIESLDGLIIDANGDLLSSAKISAKNDVRIYGFSGSRQFDGAEISAGRDLVIETKNHQQKFNGTTISVGRDISLESKGEIILDKTTVNSENKILIEALNETNIDDTEISGKEILFSGKEISINQSSIKAHKKNSDTINRPLHNKALRIAGDTVSIKDTSIKSYGDLKIEAVNDLELQNVISAAYKANISGNNLKIDSSDFIFDEEGSVLAIGGSSASEIHNSSIQGGKVDLDLRSNSDLSLQNVIADVSDFSASIYGNQKDSKLTISNSNFKANRFYFGAYDIEMSDVDLEIPDGSLLFNSVITAKADNSGVYDNLNILAKYNSRNSNELNFAGNDIVIKNSKIDSALDFKILENINFELLTSDLKARTIKGSSLDTVLITNSNLTSPGPISLNASKDIGISNSIINATKDININVRKDISLENTDFISQENVSLNFENASSTKVNIQAEGNIQLYGGEIVIDQAMFNAKGDISFYSTEASLNNINMVAGNNIRNTLFSGRIQSTDFFAGNDAVFIVPQGAVEVQNSNITSKSNTIFGVRRTGSLLLEKSKIRASKNLDITIQDSISGKPTPQFIINETDITIDQSLMIDTKAGLLSFNNSALTADFVGGAFTRNGTLIFDEVALTAKNTLLRGNDVKLKNSEFNVENNASFSYIQKKLSIENLILKAKNAEFISNKEVEVTGANKFFSEDTHFIKGDKVSFLSDESQYFGNLFVDSRHTTNLFDSKTEISKLFKITGVYDVNIDQSDIRAQNIIIDSTRNASIKNSTFRITEDAILSNIGRSVYVPGALSLENVALRAQYLDITNGQDVYIAGNNQITAYKTTVRDADQLSFKSGSVSNFSHNLALENVGNAEIYQAELKTGRNFVGTGGNELTITNSNIDAGLNIAFDEIDDVYIDDATLTADEHIAFKSQASTVVSNTDIKSRTQRNVTLSAETGNLDLENVSAGDVANLVLRAQDDLYITDLQATASRDISLHSGNLTATQLSLNAADVLTLSAEGDLDITTAALTAGSHLNVEGANITLTESDIKSTGEFRIRTQDSLFLQDIQADIAQTSWIYSDGNLSSDAVTLSSGQDVTITSGGQVDFIASDFTSDGWLSITGTTGLNLAEVNLTSGKRTLVRTDAALTATDVTMTSQADILLNGKQSLEGTNLDLTSAAHTSLISHAALTIADTDIKAQGNMQLNTHGFLDVSNTILTADEHLTLIGKTGATVSDATLTSGKGTRVLSDQFADITDTVITSGQGINFNAKDGLVLTGINATTDVNIWAISQGDVDIYGSELTGGEHVTVGSRQNLSIQDTTLTSTDNLNIYADGDLDLIATDVTATADKINVSSKQILTVQDSHLKSDSAIALHGTDLATFNGDNHLETEDLKLYNIHDLAFRDGEFLTQSDIDVRNVNNYEVANARLASSGDVILTARQGASVTNATIEAGKEIELGSLTTLAIANSNLNSNGASKLVAKQHVSLSGTNQIDASKTDIESTGNISLSGDLTASGRLRMDAKQQITAENFTANNSETLHLKSRDGIELKNTMLLSNQRVLLDAKQGHIILDGSTISSEELARVQAGGNIIADNGNIDSLKDVFVQAGLNLSMTGTTIVSGQDSMMRAGLDVVASNSNLESDRDLTIIAGASAIFDAVKYQHHSKPNEHNTYNSVTYLETQLSAGRDLKILAGGNIYAIGTKVECAFCILGHPFWFATEYLNQNGCSTFCFRTV